MKTVLLLLATDRHSFPLIQYLIGEGKRHNWKIVVGSLYDASITDRIGEKFGSNITVINIMNTRTCDQAIRKANLVIGMMPDTMLLKIADNCLLHGKSLITPSRLNRQMILKKAQAEENDTLLLMECGFSPGLDHITAKKAIDTIQAKGGEIISFRTYSGSLPSENSISNPWGFLLTESLTDMINFGKRNNRHIINGEYQHIPYHRLFTRTEPMNISGLTNIVSVPEGDSLYYRKIYNLGEATSVLKGKLLKPEFAATWNIIVNLGLTDTFSGVDMPEDTTFSSYLNSLLPYDPSLSLEKKLMKYGDATMEDIENLRWLGLLGDGWIEGNKAITPAGILQHLIQKKFAPQANDKDCIVMQHHLEYMYQNVRHQFTATLIEEGDNSLFSATAKAVGLTMGAAAKAFLLGNINVKGLQTPTRKDIYDPILNELDDQGVAFHIEEKKIHLTNEGSAVTQPM